MKNNGLLLRNKGTRNPPREHTGKVCVPTPNTRWASDLTRIRLWDGTRLRFTYILDCCDRSIISYRIGRYMWAVDVEQMLQEALLKRFDQLPAPHELEFLHDNGPEYLENALQKQLKDWNIKNCNTPIYSPQSNGMCEAFNAWHVAHFGPDAALDRMRAGIRRLNAAQGTINDITRRNEDGTGLAHRRWPPFQLRVKPPVRPPGIRALSGVRGRGDRRSRPWNSFFQPLVKTNFSV
jgi:transposase InsO family protein